MFQRKCGELCYFALRLPDGEIRIVSMERLETFRNRGKKRMTDTEIRNETWSLKAWIEASDTWSENV